MNGEKEQNKDDLLGSFLNVMRKNDPRLKDDQEIPEKVMQSIQALKQQTSPEKSSRIRYLTYAQRWLTAASVCLLILYGIEEFTMVKKMNTLEEHVASFKVEPGRTTYRRFAKNMSSVHSFQKRFPGRLKFFPAKQYLSQSQTNQSFKSLIP